MSTTNEPQKIVMVSEKSMVATILLTFFFGPLGLFYATVNGGIIMLIISIVVAIFTLGIGLLITIPICVIWGVVATNNYNSNLRAGLNN